MAKRGVVVVLLVIAGAAQGCSIETDKCTATRIEAEDVADVRAATARLVTASGDPLPDRVLELGLRVPDVPGNATARGKCTDANGAVTFDLPAAAREDPFVAQYLPNVTQINWYYRNPDALDDTAQPNYCSSEKTVNVSR